MTQTRQREEPRWLFLTNHTLVLLAIRRNPELSQREIALLVGVTENAVQRLVSDLENAGYLHTFREGRRKRYKVNMEQPLRHPMIGDATIGDLLRLLTRRKRRTWR